MNLDFSAEELTASQIRQARRFAVQLIYQLDLNQQMFLDERTFQVFFQQFEVPAQERSFIEQVVSRPLARISEIDSLVSKCSLHWKISRIAKVDLAILRICSLELMERTQISVDVIIADGAEMGKEYGSINSSAFVNGLLDAITKSVRVME